MALDDLLADAAAEIREYLEDKESAVHYSDIRPKLQEIVKLMEEVQERIASTQGDILQRLIRRLNSAT